MADHDAMRLQELASMSETLHELTPAEWDHDSLCDGWRVRDVVSHIVLGYTTPLPRMMAKVARHGFDVPRTSRVESAAYGASHEPDDILRGFDRIHREDIRRGISRMIKASEGLVDHVVHHQDVRRPLGLDAVVPEDRLVAALGVAQTLGGFVGAKKRAAGLRLRATDVGWSSGDGPEVRGPGEAILLALTGRPVALADLDGDGLEVLRGRIAG